MALLPNVLVIRGLNSGGAGCQMIPPEIKKRQKLPSAFYLLKSLILFYDQPACEDFVLINYNGKKIQTIGETSKIKN